MRRVIVSLHDVAPPYEADIRAQLEELRRLSVERCVLKVVPNWHGQHQLSRSPSLIDLLVRQVNAGSQVILHGYRHEPVGVWRGSPARMARARLFASRAAEFMTMSGAEARLAVERGLDELERSDLPPPDTFCAPGWLLSDEAENAVTEAGIRYLVGMFSLQDLRRRTLRWVPARGYMGAGRLHGCGAGVLAAMVGAVAGRATVRKVYLHPDTSGRRGWLKTINLVRDLLDSGWEPSTFGDLARELDG